MNDRFGGTPNYQLWRIFSSGDSFLSVCEDLGSSIRQLSRWRDGFRLKGDLTTTLSIS